MLPRTVFHPKIASARFYLIIGSVETNASGCGIAVYSKEIRATGWTALEVRKHILTRKKLSFFFALLLVAIWFSLEFHHHDDGAIHPDCSFCAAIHQSQSTSVPHQETGSPVVAQASLEFPPEQPEPVSLHLDVPVIRPPPRLIPA